MYALTKKINEEISTIYNNYYKLKVTGLRFFTVYGEWVARYDDIKIYWSFL